MAISATKTMYIKSSESSLGETIVLLIEIIWKSFSGRDNIWTET